MCAPLNHAEVFAFFSSLTKRAADAIKLHCTSWLAPRSPEPCAQWRLPSDFFTKRSQS
jgi:hypothetical protein